VTRRCSPHLREQPLACPLASVTPGLSGDGNAVLGTCSMCGTVEATIGSTAGAAACVTEMTDARIPVDPISSLTKAIPDPADRQERKCPGIVRMLVA
jgi:hypothetical protein